MQARKALLLAALLWAAGALAAAHAETYAYDALGRLVSVITDDGRHVTYTYDAAGNRVRATVS